MATIRELTVKFGFNADFSKLEAFDKALVKATGNAEALGVMVTRVGGLITAMGTEAALASKEITKAISIPPNMINAANGFVRLKTKINETANAAVVLGNRIKGIPTVKGIGGAGVAAAGASKKGGGFGGPLGHILPYLGVYMGGAAAINSVEKFAEYQQNMQKAGAAMLGSAQDIAEMKKKVLAVASMTGFDLTKVSSAAIEIGSRGFGKQGVIDLLPTAMKLARGGMVDPTLATDMLVTTMRQFYGNDTSKAAHVGDVLARAHDVGGIKIPALKTAMNYVAPAARALNNSLEDTATMLAVLGQWGLTGSLAGNAMKSMMIKLAAPNFQSQRKLAAAGMAPEVTGATGHHNRQLGGSMAKMLGLKLMDEHHNMLPMLNIMKQIAQKIGTKGTKDQAAIIKGLFGLEQVPQAMAMLNAMLKDGGKQFADIEYKMHHTDGSLQKMNDTLMKGLTPAWQVMTTKIQILTAHILERLTPTLVDLMHAIGNVAEFITNFIDTLQDWYDNNVIFQAGVDSLTFAVKALTIALGLIIIPAAVIAGLNAFLAFLVVLRLRTLALIPLLGTLATEVVIATWPFVLMAIAVGAAYLAIKTLINTIILALDQEGMLLPFLKRVERGFKDISNTVKDTTKSISDFLHVIGSALTLGAAPDKLFSDLKNSSEESNKNAWANAHPTSTGASRYFDNKASKSGPEQNRWGYPGDSSVVIHNLTVNESGHPDNTVHAVISGVRQVAGDAGRATPGKGGGNKAKVKGG